MISACVIRPALIGIINKGNNGASLLAASSIFLGIEFFRINKISNRIMPMIELGTGMAIQDWIASPRTRKTKRTNRPFSMISFL